MPALSAIRTDKPRHPELGEVRWMRDFDAALAQSAATGMPVLVLFDEVPGCETCVNYGQQVLSHPLIVEAIETLFVPVAVFNNVQGKDREVLKSFEEPEWNNPVVRIVDSKRRMLAPRVAEEWTAVPLVGAMTKALRDSGKAVPAYLALLEAEALAADRIERATFAMHCFWEGEAKLGALGGVLETRTGFLQGDEVVEVRFDPRKLSFGDLVSKARELECAGRVFARSDSQLSQARKVIGDAAARSDEPMKPSLKDDKYQLRERPIAGVPMTELQAARVNAVVGAGKDPAEFLSPRQVELLRRLEALPDSKSPKEMIGRADLAQAWREAWGQVMSRN